MAFLYVCYGYKVGKMANIEIKDGEYTKTIYSMIKEQRYDHFRLGTTASKKKIKGFISKIISFLSWYN